MHRNTNQRQIVYDSINYLGHTTSENLINYINDNYDNISLATIYRNLNILMEENQIKKIKIGQQDIFETVKNKHYHYQCKLCNEIVDIDVDLIPFNVNTIKSKDKIFNVIDNDIVLYGICDKCIEKI